ncbi:PorV/PorQ family protein [bacterium]|nr:PorV/PorQ family protein [bacterium]
MSKKINKIKVNLLLLVSICFLSATAYAAGGEEGTAGAQFLKIGCGVRAIGMGEAYSGVADDVNAIYWNPAGLNYVDNIHVYAMHTVWLEEMNYDYVAFARPFLGGVIGTSLNYLSMSGIDKMNEYGEKEGTFSPYDVAINVAYAREFGKVKSGINLKFIKQEIGDESATGYAVDLGLMHKFLEDKMQLGLAVQNLGPEITFIEESAPLPMTIRLGVGYKLNEKIILSLDTVAPVDEDISFRVGSEYSFKGIENFPIACRVGYKTNTTEDLDAFSGFSGGMGFILHGLEVNYAWVPYGDLGDTHRISLGTKFGGETEKIEKVKKISKKEKKVIIKKAEKYYVQGLELYKQKKYKQTLKQLKKVLKLNPAHQKAKKLEKAAIIRIFYREGVEYYKSGKYMQAISQMEAILKLRPTHKSAKKLKKKAENKLKK